MTTNFMTKGRGSDRKVIPLSGKATSKRRMLMPKYTALEKAVMNLMVEDTGSNLLDSGGAYGRHYERNQKVKNWNKVPELEFDDSGITRNIFPFLVKSLDITSESRKLQERFDKMMAKSDEAYLSDMEQFIDALAEKGDLDEDGWLVAGKPEAVNTYNADSLLSQILQYMLFYKDGEYYILLQVHNGCDARGGYTRPKIFRVTDPETFITEQTSASVMTKKGSYYTDDTYNFYSDEQEGTKQWEDLYAEGIVSVA